MECAKELAMATKTFFVATLYSVQLKAPELSLIFLPAVLGMAPSFRRVAEKVFKPAAACSEDTVLEEGSIWVGPAH